MKDSEIQPLISFLYSTLASPPPPRRRITLPSDILEQIFIECRNSCLNTANPNSWIHVSRVSRLWRETALGYSFLWTILPNIWHPDGLSQFADRSASVPLELVYQYPTRTIRPETERSSSSDVSWKEFKDQDFRTRETSGTEDRASTWDRLVEVVPRIHQGFSQVFHSNSHRFFQITARLPMSTLAKLTACLSQASLPELRILALFCTKDDAEGTRLAAQASGHDNSRLSLQPFQVPQLRTIAMEITDLTQLFICELSGERYASLTALNITHPPPRKMAGGWHLQMITSFYEIFTLFPRLCSLRLRYRLVYLSHDHGQVQPPPSLQKLELLDHFEHIEKVLDYLLVDSVEECTLKVDSHFGLLSSLYGQSDQGREYDIVPLKLLSQTIKSIRTVYISYTKAAFEYSLYPQHIEVDTVVAPPHPHRTIAWNAQDNGLVAYGFFFGLLPEHFSSISSLHLAGDFTPMWRSSFLHKLIAKQWTQLSTVFSQLTQLEHLSIGPGWHPMSALFNDSQPGRSTPFPSLRRITFIKTRLLWSQEVANRLLPFLQHRAESGHRISVRLVDVDTSFSYDGEAEALKLYCKPL